jgi:tetratricopeptide (TPR) repeat protein
MNLGDLLSATARAPAAEAEFRAALALCEALAVEYPADASYPGWIRQNCRKLGLLCAAMNRPAEAREWFLKESALAGGDPTAHRELADVFFQQGMLPEAEAEAREAIRLKPDLAVAHCRLAFILQRNGKLADAEAALKEADRILKGPAAAGAPPPTESSRVSAGHTLSQVGEAWLELNRLDDAEQAHVRALETFRQLTADYPANPFYRQEQGYRHRHLANVMERAGRADDAERHLREASGWYRKLMAEWPDAPFYRQEEAHTRSRMADLMLRAGRRAEAEATLAEAARLEHGDAGTYYAVGGAYARLGRWEEAAAAYDRGLALDPADVFRWFRGSALRLASGDVEGYRAACGEMLKRFGGTDVPLVAECVAKPCLVVPGAVDDLGPVEKLAERAVAGTEKHGSHRWFLLVKAMAEYRAGRDAEAARWVGKYAPRADGVHGDASAFALLAMAQHRLGGAQAAAEALERSRKIIEQKQPDPAKGTLFGELDFQDWVHCQTLCREAEALVTEVRQQSSSRVPSRPAAPTDAVDVLAGTRPPGRLTELRP